MIKKMDALMYKIISLVLVFFATTALGASYNKPTAEDKDYYRSYMEAVLAKSYCSDWHVEMSQGFFESYKFSRKLSDKEIEKIFKETTQRHTSLIQTNRLEFCDTYLDHIRNTYKKILRRFSLMGLIANTIKPTRNTLLYKNLSSVCCFFNSYNDYL